MTTPPGKRENKKPASAKSQVFRFRLHPEVEAEREAMDIIAGFEREHGIALREFITLAAHALAGRELPSTKNRVNARQLNKMYGLLEQIYDAVKSGLIVRNEDSEDDGGGMDEDFLDSLNRFVEQGRYADEED